MATEKLFYQDAHQAQFRATVLSCRPGKHGYDVVLDRTCFYPEGGGQPGDTGTLSGVRVTDTHEVGGEIVHYCDSPLAEGQTVEGTIDYDRRFELMQLHTGEHILSGVIHRRFGYENVGFHMGADFVTIDLSGMLTPEQVQSVEAEANEWIWKNVPVEVSYPDPDTLKTIPYRSKKELTGQVRIVTIPGADICACCGTHVSNTGEIGLLRIFSCVRFHDGVRLELLCGRRALRYLRALTEQNRQVSGLLSAKPLETAGAVQRLLDAEGALKLRAAALEDAVFTQKAQALAGTGNALLFEPAMSPDSVRRLTDLVMSACGGRAAVFAGSDEAGYKYAVGEQGGDLRQLVRELNTALQGRGGGKPFFAQGSVSASRAAIEAFFRERGE